MSDTSRFDFHETVLKGKRDAGRMACTPFPSREELVRIQAGQNIDPRFSTPYLTPQQMEARAIDSMIAGHYGDPRHAHCADFYMLFCEPLGARSIDDLAFDAALVKSQLDIWENDMRRLGADAMKTMPGFHDCDIITHDELLKRIFKSLPSPPTL